MTRTTQQLASFAWPQLHNAATRELLSGAFVQLQAAPGATASAFSLLWP